MKKVLIITYFFPPRTGIGSLRLGAIAENLKKTGNYYPIILTPPLDGKKDNYKIYEVNFWDTQKIQRNKQKNIKLSKKNYIKDYLKSKIKHIIKEIIFFPDFAVFWIKPAIKKGKEIIEKDKIDYILSSHSPASTHIIAWYLHKKYNIPWVADFRDLWTQNHYYNFSIIRKKIEEILEKIVISSANCLTTVSKPFAEDLQSKFKSKKIMVIPTGYKKEKIKGINISNDFEIVYTGYLYKGKRNPYLLLKAITDLVKERLIDPEKIKINFYGPYSEFMDEMINYFGVNQFVKQNGIISREEAVQKQREAQLLLLLLWNNPKERGVIPGKIFEYLSAERPMIVLGAPEPSVTKDIIISTNTGYVCNNYEDIKKILLKTYNEFLELGYVKYTPNLIELQKLEQKNTMQKFVKIFEELK